MRRLEVAVERWPVAGAFTIARGAKTHVDVVVATVRQGVHAGRGEATAIYYHGETAEGVAAQLRQLEDEVAAGLTRDQLQTLLPRGAARNALDCALWALDAEIAGVPLWQLARLNEPQPLTTAFTLSLADPDVMEAAARAAAHLPLLKLKLAGEGDLERVAAVRRGAPAARLIVDANEAWTGRDVSAEAAALLPFGVELIEQPVARDADALLDGVRSPIPLCADESCQDRADLPRLRGRYAAVNIKLDKAGGLTEALALRRAAEAEGFAVMLGCMLSTSLGIAPAFLAAQGARWVDLDGPLLLARDRADGFTFDRGTMRPGGLSFRPATEADVPALHRLVESAYRGDSARAGWTHEADLLTDPRSSPDALARTLGRQGEHIILAHGAQGLVGCVQVTDLGHGRAYLGLLAVEPARQAGGLGRRLVAAAEDEARGFGATSMELGVIPQRSELIAWYERRGYRRTGETRPFPIPLDPPFSLVVLARDL